MDNPNKDSDITYLLLTLFVRTGASSLLFLSSLPRVTKGPIPIVLAVTAAGTGLYYGKTVFGLRAH